MQTQSHKYTVQKLSFDLVQWFVEIAATDMLVNELKRPELYNLSNMYVLAEKMAREGTAFVVTKEGKPVGALGALLVPNLFNPNIITLAEIFWYVPPEYRRSRVGAMLLDEFDKLGNSIADEYTLSLIRTSEVNTKSLTKRGFNLEELAFRKKTYGSD